MLFVGGPILVSYIKSVVLIKIRVTYIKFVVLIYNADIPNLIFSCTYRNYIVTLCRLFADKDDRYTIDTR